MIFKRHKKGIKQNDKQSEIVQNRNGIAADLLLLLFGCRDMYAAVHRIL